MFQPYLFAAMLLIFSGSAETANRFFPPQTNAQEFEALDQGRKAYQKGEFEQALASLKQAAESATKPPLRADALYYLGRSYYSLKRYDEALASYHQLLGETPSYTLARYELGKTYVALKDYAHAAEQHALLKELGHRLEEEAKQRTANSPAPQRPESGALQINATTRKGLSQADDLALYLADLFPTEEAARYQVLITPLTSGTPAPATADQPLVWQMGKDGVTKPTILYKEKAKYTEVARQNYVQGTVVLSVVFSDASAVTDVRVVRGLPDGLTRQAIEAALKIRFQPATKDGALVSVRGNLEFTFNLY